MFIVSAMRPLVPVLLLGLSACASTSAPPLRPVASDRVQTTDQYNRSSVSTAVTAPARDLNMLRTKIPPVLLEALDDPYKRPNPATCAELVALVRPLDEALGPDIDTPPSGDERGLFQRGADAAEDGALGFVADAAQDLIPMRGWVRRLSGAERHDKMVRSAIAAGGIRRGYLKGLGEAKGCGAPATPTHIKSELPREADRRGPKYPIKR